MTDLEEAIALLRQAVGATPDDHPERAGRFSNLGIALRSRFDRSGTLTDLDEAINLGRQAVRATPDDHPDLAIYQANLASMLQGRFDRTEATEDRDAAVTGWVAAAKSDVALPSVRVTAGRAAGGLLRGRFPAGHPSSWRTL